MVNSISNSVVDQLLAGLNHILPRIPIALLALLVGIVIIRIIAWIVRFILHLSRLPKGFKGILRSLTSAVLVVLLITAVLQILGFNNIIFLFSGSLAAIGIGMAAGGSTLISDVLAGVFLAQDTDFDVGDEIKAGENQTTGIVESMDMRRTRIRDTDGHLHIIPNSVIERKEWVVLTPAEQQPTLAKALRQRLNRRKVTTNK